MESGRPEQCGSDLSVCRASCECWVWGLWEQFVATGPAVSSFVCALFEIEFELLLGRYPRAPVPLPWAVELNFKFPVE